MLSYECSIGARSLRRSFFLVRGISGFAVRLFLLVRDLFEDWVRIPPPRALRRLPQLLGLGQHLDVDGLLVDLLRVLHELLHRVQLVMPETKMKQFLKSGT